MVQMTRAVGLVACMVLAGCQGATGATPSPTIVTPLATASPTAAPPTASPEAVETVMPSPQDTPIGPFTLTSTAFEQGGSIPKQDTCDGKDTSPPLAWTGAPAGTATLALVMTDPDAGGFVHWVVYNIAASGSGEFPAGLTASQEGWPQGRNSFGRVGYGGPCPPSGTHHYVFRLLALDVSLPLSGTPTATQVLDAAKGHILAETKLTGTYRRGG